MRHSILLELCNEHLIYVLCGRQGKTVEQLVEETREQRLEAAKAQAAASAPSPEQEEALKAKAASQSTKPLEQVSVGSMAKTPYSEESPVKPLDSILDVKKLMARDPQPTEKEISALWTAYHAANTSNKVGAVVPLDMYQQMTSLAKRYPEFIFALPRTAQTPEGEEQGAEVIFMQWSFVPSKSPPQQCGAETATVLFTSLAAYKTHGTFAQPALILTHYPDLADSHGIVLMRGDITSSPQADQPAMSAQDVQLLCLRLQQYYGDEKEDSEQRKFLKSFHGKDGESQEGFDFDRLVKSAWEVGL